MNFVSFLLGFQMALVLYVLSEFIALRSGIGNVSIFYLLGFAGSLFIFLNLHHLFKRYGKISVFLIFLGLRIFALLGLVLLVDWQIAVIFAIWSQLADALIWAGIDVLVESASKNKVTGAIRGKILTLINAGIFLAPLLAAYLIKFFGYRWLFFSAAVVSVLSLAIIWRKFVNADFGPSRELNLKASFLALFQKKNIARICYLSFLLEFFYATMVVYTPLYLLQAGFSLIGIGKILTVMLLPFVLLQYPLGKLADKKTGEKEWLLVALVFIAIITGALSFMQSADLVSWMAALFLTRVGAAIIEVMNDSYFYKQVSGKDVTFIDFYRANRSLAYIVSMLIFGPFLIFLPLRWVFLTLGVVMLSGLIPAWKLKDSR